MEGHTEGGARYQQSAKAGGTKDLWPEGMDEGQIEKALREAYGNAKTSVGNLRREGIL